MKQHMDCPVTVKLKDILEQNVVQLEQIKLTNVTIQSLSEEEKKHQSKLKNQLDQYRNSTIAESCDK